ncbi:hypothetical protein [Novosphingobium sp. AP12]|uniref:hypothetical protein n=1 Tax=Novosphingobium sp. AP12 TaxID=1144305 RepID=UPI00055DBE2D|nr:hypothetical protein [Novosphingobium sp. AP12]
MSTVDEDGTVDVRLVLDRHAQQTRELAQAKADLLKAGGGGGISDGMDGRVSKLEAHMEHVREDMRDIKQVLGDVATKLDRLTELPTKSDLSSWKLQWTALAFAAVAIIIGGIIGGLAWIQPTPERSSPPQPIVITLPKN